MQKIEDWLTEHGFSGFVFKIFAIISMCIDHIGAVMFPEWTWMRIIGRFAFPIFCFFLAEGAYYTSNIRKYEMRLLLFAILSEVPFDLAFYRQPVYWYHQNVFFTLFFGLLTLDLLMHLKNYLLRVGSFVGIGLLCEAIHTDYGIVGILFIVLFFCFKRR
jgi:hypothetical protein